MTKQFIIPAIAALACGITVGLGVLLRSETPILPPPSKTQTSDEATLRPRAETTQFPSTASVTSKLPPKPASSAIRPQAAAKNDRPAPRNEAPAAISGQFIQNSSPTRAESPAPIRAEAAGNLSSAIPASVSSRVPVSSISAGNPPATASANSTAGATEDIPVPSGAKLPAAIMDESEDVSPQQAQALDSISEDFLDDVQDGDAAAVPVPPTAGEEAGVETSGWEAARMNADEQYRMFFGDEAYNRQSMAAAQEALLEK